MREKEERKKAKRVRDLGRARASPLSVRPGNKKRASTTTTTTTTSLRDALTRHLAFGISPGTRRHLHPSDLPGPDPRKKNTSSRPQVSVPSSAGPALPARLCLQGSSAARRAARVASVAPAINARRGRSLSGRPPRWPSNLRSADATRRPAQARTRPLHGSEQSPSYKARETGYVPISESLDSFDNTALGCWTQTPLALDSASDVAVSRPAACNQPPIKSCQ